MLQLINSLGLEGNCMLLPFNPNIIDLLAACDLLVFPATKPYFARPVIEAAAMGKPVVASDLQAIDELVLDGETGFSADYSNARVFARKIITILNNDKMQARMGEAGVKFAEEHFSYSEQIKKLKRPILDYYYNNRGYVRSFCRCARTRTHYRARKNLHYFSRYPLI